MLAHTFSTVFAALLVLFSLASALPLTRRDVWDPPVLTPTTGTVWTVGQSYNVTWNTTNPPAEITNTIGTVYLRQGDETLVDSPLAGNFSILLGSVEVTVPDVTPGDDWIIVLMGDSGNWSPEFTIQAAST